MRQGGAVRPWPQRSRACSGLSPPCPRCPRKTKRSEARCGLRSVSFHHGRSGRRSSRLLLLRKPSGLTGGSVDITLQIGLGSRQLRIVEGRLPARELRQLLSRLAVPVEHVPMLGRPIAMRMRGHDRPVSGHRAIDPGHPAILGKTIVGIGRRCKDRAVRLFELNRRSVGNDDAIERRGEKLLVIIFELLGRVILAQLLRFLGDLPVGLGHQGVAMQFGGGDPFAVPRVEGLGHHRGQSPGLGLLILSDIGSLGIQGAERRPPRIAGIVRQSLEALAAVAHMPVFNASVPIAVYGDQHEIPAFVSGDEAAPLRRRRTAYGRRLEQMPRGLELPSAHLHRSLPGALGLVGQCSQGSPLVVQEGNRTALHFEGGEFGLIHLLEEPLDALGRVAARLLDDLGINGVHRVVIDKNAPALPISLPIRQAPGLGLRLGLRLWLWLWLRRRNGS